MEFWGSGMAPKRRRGALSAAPSSKCGRRSSSINADDDQTLGIAKKLMQFDVPIAKIVAATAEASQQTITHRVISADMSEASQTSTPYGIVAEEIVVPLLGGGETKLYFNNPFTLLYAAAAKKKGVWQVLASTLGSEGRQVCIPRLLFGRDNAWQQP